MQRKVASGDCVYQETEIDDGGISPTETTNRFTDSLSENALTYIRPGPVRALIGLGIP